MPSRVSMREVFNDCQGGLHSHGRLIKTLTAIYNSMPLDVFWEEYIHYVKYSMIVFKREPAVERTIEFIAKFATSLTCGQPKDKPAPKDKPERKNEDRPLHSDDDDDNQDEEEEEEVETHPFCLKFFEFLLSHHNANDKAVRFRCCHLVNKLLNSMGDEAQIDDELYDKIFECMLQRVRDKFPIVRVQAILALSRLQDPTDPACRVINAYLFLLGCDTSPDVRRAVLSCIAASTKTLPAILERTRDIKDVVRKLAFTVIADKVHIKALTIAQRVRLLQDGLNDRVDAVRDACSSRLLQAWLRLYEGNILELLKCLDVENSLETTELALFSLFRKSPVDELIKNFDILNQDLVVPVEELTCESALYWRCLCQHINRLGEMEEKLERVLPNGTAFCKYLTSLVKLMEMEESLEQQMRNEFILQQLLTLAAVLDLSDEVGRKNLKELLRHLLTNQHIAHTLVVSVLPLYVTIETDAEARVTQLTEVISDIREPITVMETTVTVEAQRQTNLKLAGIRVELNQLREEMETCVHAQEFERAAELKARVQELEAAKHTILEETLPPSQEVRTEKNDPATLIKCLTIACEMLQEVSFRGLTPTLQTLMETLILPGIQNADPAVRNLAIEALGKCSLLSRETAMANLLLFLQVIQIDQESIKLTALKVLFDLLHSFGLDAFQVDSDAANTSQIYDSAADAAHKPDFGSDDEEEEEEEEASLDASDSSDGAEKKDDEKLPNTASSVLNILIGLLDSQSSEMRTVSAEGLAKLLLSGRLVSPKLLSRLLLLWYNPLTEDDAHLRHCLGAFFPIYAFAGRANQDVVQEAFLPTLRTLFRAPSTSPLAEINVNNVTDLLVQLTSSRHLMRTQADVPDEAEESSPHDALAIKVCNELLGDPKSFDVRTLARVLNTLELGSQNSSNLKDLKVLGRRMLKDVRDKQCSKMLEKFVRTVKDLLLAAGHSVTLSNTMDDTNLTKQDQSQEEDMDTATEADTATEGADTATEGATTEATVELDQEKEQDKEAAVDISQAQAQEAKPKSARGKNGRGKAADAPPQAAPPRAAGARSSKAKTATPRGRKGRARQEQESPSSDGEENVFASPMPEKRVLRSRRSKAGAKDATRKNLEEMLSDADSDTESPATRTRNLKQPRTPLSDIENEVK